MQTVRHSPSVAYSQSIDASAERSEQEEGLPAIHRRMLAAYQRDQGNGLFERLAEVFASACGATTVVRLQRKNQSELEVADWFRATGSDSAPTLPVQLISLAEQSCRAGASRSVTSFDGTDGAVATPVFMRGRAPEAIVAIMASAQIDPDSIVLALQLLSAHWTLALAHHQLDTGVQSDATGRLACRVSEALLTSPDEKAFAQRLLHSVQQSLGLERGVLGVRRSARAPCKLLSLSGSKQLDYRSDTVQQLEAALDEVVAWNQIILIPSSESDSPDNQILRNAANVLHAKAIVGIPLQDGSASVVGALLLTTSPEKVKRLANSNALLAVSTFAGRALTAHRRQRLRAFERAITGLQSCYTSKKRLVVLLLIVACLGALFTPWPDGVACECELRPTTRRYVAAPYDGLLERALASPGDIVAKGQLLAVMDRRELRLEAARLEAERNSATKRRDAALAAGKITEAQLAALDVDRIDLEQRLLDHREQNCNINSPMHGVLLSGDLARVEGAVLKCGQTLFEIAPLESVIAELEVPEEHVTDVTVGQEVRIMLDAYAGQVRHGHISKIHPKAEMRGDRSVFIAEVRLDNAGGQLRPGMKGRAKAMTGRTSLAWSVVRRPWRALTTQFRW